MVCCKNICNAILAQTAVSLMKVNWLNFLHSFNANGTDDLLAPANFLVDWAKTWSNPHFHEKETNNNKK